MFVRHTAFILFTLSSGLWKNAVFGSESSERPAKGWLSDWTDCCLGPNPTRCLEERTIHYFQGFNVALRNDLGLDDVSTKGSNRLGKALNEEKDVELQTLESDNERVMKQINEKDSSSSRGVVDEIGDFFIYLTSKIFSPFIGGSSDSSDEEVESSQKQAIEERGHKKKELKKKNKQLKLILLLMLFKNKIKMFVNKLQFFVQLKFLGVATINMLANVIRLWLELKKKHKPNKVVFYENAHHQHHYDHEHFDHDEPSYGRPSHYSHYAHHEEEDYGGGPWPWSRSYDKPNSQTFKALGPNQYRPSGYRVAYYDQRNLS